MSDKLEPRQLLFLTHYLDPKSKTFSNAYQSALLAGFSEEYAQNMTGQMPDWLSESISDLKMLNKAEKNLDEFLDDKEDKKIKADITKFVASRLGKKKWSERQEHDHTTKGKEINGFNFLIPNGTDDRTNSETAPSVGKVMG